MSEMELSAGEATPGQLVTKITVGGFKSIREDQTIDVRPLTLLAGKNSAGKSSLMQPLLLLKQSLESPIDPPGGVLLNGPNVKFTSANQLLSRGPSGVQSEFRLAIGGDHSALTYRKVDEHNIRIAEMGDGTFPLRDGMQKQEIYQIISKVVEEIQENPEVLTRFAAKFGTMPALAEFPAMSIQRRRCFLELVIEKSSAPAALWQTLAENLKLDSVVVEGPFKGSRRVALTIVSVIHAVIENEQRRLARMFSNIIHLPGLRGHPERQYDLTSWGDTFPGTFEKYAASVLYGWQERNQPEALAAVEADLVELDLANHVRARPKDGTSVEVEVKPGAGGSEVVSLADVGLGVSQCLPVVVALHVAKPNQLVYLEQPEIHLHPRAQVALATVLARAVRRGVRMIVETHSDHLLLGIQTLVAKGEVKPEDVKLHWFQHDAKERTTRIHSADVDDSGGFGTWPEDFSDVDMESRAAYLDAVSAQRKNKAKPSS